MRGRAIAVLAALATLGVAPCRADPEGPAAHRADERLRPARRSFHRPPVARLRPLPPLRIDPPGRFLPPPSVGLSPLEEDQRPGPVPLSHGFHLTVPIGGGSRPPPPALLKRYGDVGQALAACWRPPAGLSWTGITVRVSFKRDGSVNGVPRVPYAAAGSAEQKSGLARSLLTALKDCTPLPVSSSLGSAIAGEIFAIRFIHQDRP